MFYVNGLVNYVCEFILGFGFAAACLFLLYFESKIYVLVVWKWDKMAMVIYLLIHVYV
jgi:hypothetical protein